VTSGKSKVGVGVMVGEGVIVGVRVMVGVNDWVGVRINVEVGSGVGEYVRVGCGVCVEVGRLVGYEVAVAEIGFEPEQPVVIQIPKNRIAATNLTSIFKSNNIEFRTFLLIAYSPLNKPALIALQPGI
jgi:hypothetical protein